MFPHTITVFGKQKKDKSYPRYIIKNVLWYGSETMIIAGKGIQNNDSINVLIPKESIINSELPEDFAIEKGFRIVKGIVPDITNTITELNQHKDYITVSSINDYRLGSGLDSISVSGS